MGHYRKLTLESGEYLYNIGRRFVHLKSPNGKSESVPKDKVGLLKRKGQFRGKEYVSAIITPQTLKDYIELGGVKTPEHYLQSCNCVDVEKFITPSPYWSEIDGNYTQYYLCEKCYLEDSYNI